MPGDDPLGRPFGGVANSGRSLLHITVIQGHGRGYPASGSSVLSKSSTGRQTSQVRVRAVSTMIQTGIITIARSERPREFKCREFRIGPVLRIQIAEHFDQSPIHASIQREGRCTGSIVKS
jgi:hypothetical protein